jgi:hypothetical protein
LVTVPPLITNGGFDAGLAPWQPDESGGFVLPTTSTAESHSPPSALLLGSPTYACNAVPVGAAGVTQTNIAVPNTTNPTLTFYYNVWSQGTPLVNNAAQGYSFDAYVNGVDDPAHRLYRNPADQVGFGCNKTAFNSEWLQVSVPLSSYKGQTISLSFELNQAGSEWNTYVYVDDIVLTP